LKYKGVRLTNQILKAENRAIIEVRENESRLFRLYAKREDALRKTISKD